MTATASLEIATARDIWDAVVIGAGPAGAVAARQLAIAGSHVLLVDKATLPRAKVCGGCLGGAALDVLDSMGLGRLPSQCSGVQLRRIELASEGAVAAFDAGRRVAIARETFDQALVTEAMAAGVAVTDATQASLATDGEASFRAVRLRHANGEGTVRAQVVLMATGLATSSPGVVNRSVPGSLVGVGALMANARVGIPPGVLRMACGAAGYVGVTAVEDGRVDVAAAVNPHSLATAPSPGDLISRIMQDAGFSRPQFEGVTWRGTPPLTRRPSSLGGHRCLLIGDAAGYVEPFTGEGIGWAMQSAMLAAALALGQLDAWSADTAMQWRRIYQREFAGRHRRCRVVTQLLRNLPVRRLALWTARHSPRLAHRVVQQWNRPFVSTFTPGNAAAHASR